MEDSIGKDTEEPVPSFGNEGASRVLNTSTYFPRLSLHDPASNPKTEHEQVPLSRFEPTEADILAPT